MAKKETAKAQQKKKETSTSNARKTVKVKFILSPLQRYRLAYGIGEEAEIEGLQAKELIDNGYAEKA